SKPWLMPSMVAAAMTPLSPGAGPPPTKIPSLPLFIKFLVVKSKRECWMMAKAQKISIPFLPKSNHNLPMQRAVFLDRDGTMIAEKNYLHRVEDVEIFPATRIGLKKMCASGFKLIIVTNQSGIGRGYFTMTDAEKVNQFLSDELGRDGIRFEKIYI